jgi:hypothetical protein
MFAAPFFQNFFMFAAPLLFDTDPDRNRVTWETPSSEAIPTVKTQKPIGVRASYATHAQTQV